MIRSLITVLLLVFASEVVFAQERDDRATHPRVPTIIVTGHGEVTAAPDLAIVRVGAVAQAEQARDAQDQVSRTMTEAVKRLNDLGVPAERITTTDLELTPVYSGETTVEQKPD